MNQTVLALRINMRSITGHRCQARNDRAWAGGRATIGARQGRVYYEITVADEGLCRVGWSTRQASLDLGNEPISFGFGGTGACAAKAKALRLVGKPALGIVGVVVMLWLYSRTLHVPFRDIAHICSLAKVQ